MFEVNVLEEPEDEIALRIEDIFESRIVDETDHDDLRPILYNVLTNWSAMTHYIDTMVYVITYVANEIDNWRLFLNDESISKFFTNDNIVNLITVSSWMYADPMINQLDLDSQFRPFLAEQFISIFETS